MLLRVNDYKNVRWNSKHISSSLHCQEGVSNVTAKCVQFVRRNNLVQTISIRLVLNNRIAEQNHPIWQLRFTRRWSYIVVFWFVRPCSLIRVSEECPEDGDRMFLRNVGNLLQDYTASQTKAAEFENHWVSPVRWCRHYFRLASTSARVIWTWRLFFSEIYFDTQFSRPTNIASTRL
jgi:hypothetical protein